MISIICMAVKGIATLFVVDYVTHPSFRLRNSYNYLRLQALLKKGKENEPSTNL